MYAVDARPAPLEQYLTHLRGYRGIGPVRIGNDAVGQFQLDVYGEVLGTMELALRRREVSEGLWKVVRHLAEATVAQWRDPDCSIWEPRCEGRHHVFSKVMAWAGLDRAARVAERTGHHEPAQRWRHEADLIRTEVLEKGWDGTRQTFVQAYGELPLDASLLAIPKVRFLERNDPRVRSTLEAVRSELATSCEELFYRYRSFDGLEGDEGAFVQSSLWVVQNLALIGEVSEADRLFRNLLRRIEPLGLAAEEIDPATGAFLGNYPQGLSHAAIINTALILQRLDATP
jgi:GH15 family glucan-1,4-alpha-glucosidase